MGRELNRPENWSKSLMTFSKRKSNLIKKARKMSASCNIDIAVVAFSPADRLNIFCSKDRIEDVLQRYIDLPADKRNRHITNVQANL
ncbi:agamous-like MADS-box protein AGL104 [Punica granatum]|uniref:Agamous-like MADS-box protein AGL104 n=1 Tax=Punica granatum TaxID=22663 RepID=A0A6P8DR99_PUNGR|nr:agamous-like MADS-box protein AGL104 [Punica granatum]